MAAIEQDVIRVGGVGTFFRHIGGQGPPVVFVHGNPTHSEDWLPFLERIDGPAVALDLPGWGYSERPPPDRFDYTLEGLGAFVGRFLEAVGITEHSLVVHDWGAVGLIAAQARPERVRRVVVINAVPLLPGYRWHWVARWFWRRRLVGELANATMTRSSLRLLSAQATPRHGRLPAEFIELVWRGRRRGTWPQMLALYRSAAPDRLARAGARLEQLQCPALVAWGRDDPYLPPEFAHAYRDRLPDARLRLFDAAGHWPWLDRPEVVDEVVGFLAAQPEAPLSHG